LANEKAYMINGEDFRGDWGCIGGMVNETLNAPAEGIVLVGYFSVRCSRRLGDGAAGGADEAVFCVVAEVPLAVGY